MAEEPETEQELGWDAEDGQELGWDAESTVGSHGPCPGLLSSPFPPKGQELLCSPKQGSLNKPVAFLLQG